MNRLRELREANNWHLSDIAAKLGTHSTTISKYELGQRALTEELINKFCDLYGVTADYLLGRSAQPHATVSNSDAAILVAYHAAPADIRAIIDTALAPYKQEQDANTTAS